MLPFRKNTKCSCFPGMLCQTSKYYYTGKNNMYEFLIRKLTDDVPKLGPVKIAQKSGLLEWVMYFVIKFCGTCIGVGFATTNCYVTPVHFMFSL